ncbi:hypothetical protein PCI56_27010 [Plesiomonas shigelloides subsp. oncorhynchi]|nr:hypothetical protein [Plesiomonas shigelloides]
MALLLPTRIYRNEFAKRHLAPENLSRIVSDAGIVTSPLIPWNSCGAYMAAVLGCIPCRICHLRYSISPPHHHTLIGDHRI